MVAAPKTASITYAEYVALERESGERYQFLSGEVFLMAGGTLRHAAIKTNLTVALGALLQGGPSRGYDADAKIRVVATGLATYPDLSVICGRPERHPEDPNAATNPTLVAEVLSPTTEGWDRGGKFQHMQRVPSLRHYLLVSADEARVEHFERGEAGAWTYRAYGPGQAMTLSGLGVTLAIDELYQNLPE